MDAQVIRPICDACAVARTIRQYCIGDRLTEVALASFDNMRSDYNGGLPFEFGGIALLDSDIKSMVQRQADELLRRAEGSDRLVVVWKAESARLYGNHLADALRWRGCIEVATHPIATKWRRTDVAEVTNADVPPSRPRDFIVACDFMMGSGATMRAISEWLEARGNPAACHCVLVNAVDYTRSARVPVLLEPCFVWRSLDWLIGYNADCPSGGVSIGRELPFLAFLRPAGMGIRGALRDALRRVRA